MLMGLATVAVLAQPLRREDAFVAELRFVPGYF